MEFLVHADVGDGEIQVTNHLLILNGLLLQLLADLLQHFNVHCVFGYALLVPGREQNNRW